VRVETLLLVAAIAAPWLELARRRTRLQAVTLFADDEQAKIAATRLLQVMRRFRRLNLRATSCLGGGVTAVVAFACGGHHPRR
jgi:hypothetical protein